MIVVCSSSFGSIYILLSLVTDSVLLLILFNYLIIFIMLKVNLIGNLGADVEQHVTGGTSWYLMNVAHTSNVKGVSVTEWCSVSINWNAEKLVPYLLKGAKVFVHGTAYVSQYENSKKAIRCKIHVIADYIQLCGGGSSVAKAPGAAPAAALDDNNPPF